MELSKAIGFAALLSIPSISVGAIVTGDIRNNTANPVVYPVASNDLLQTNLSGVPTVAGNLDKEGTGIPESSLRDSTFGGTGGQSGVTAGPGDFILYTLDTASAPLGYTINQVNTYAGWSYGRYGQGYDLSFHLVGTPGGVFTPAISVVYGPGAGENDAFPTENHPNISTFVAVTDTTGIVATGVDQVLFAFQQSPNFVGNYNGYHELDVIGAPVPEPMSLSGLALAGLGLVARRRRA